MRILGISILALGVAALVVAGVVYAQQGPGGGRGEGGPGMGPGGPGGQGGQGQMLLRLFDKNKDGQISEREWAAVFNTIDADGDGILSKDELAEARDEVREENQKRMFERFDEDGDGVITKDEFPGPDQRFDKIDADGDGKITPEELADAHKKAAEMMKKNAGKKGQGGMEMRLMKKQGQE